MTLTRTSLYQRASAQRVYQEFPKSIGHSFKRQTSITIPLLLRVYQFAISYQADGLYSAVEIQLVVKGVLGAHKHLLDGVRHVFFR
ncbi:predicted protein [Pyrenophora tritici-repentis Pt-1C-BFP]|uniref:Uncharacterized protein n=1 Tax=Pyrenophora tritici-repentis (strain Pt-1C-BFP) TaxID=426418 RepID=B2W9V9_PYRTR|nr:uncharacterized protein PTRG_06767 [Pyrenophora tritici-repentis Pt-1C-BFP]EDU49687.1 predicted protein [Pyrenophora tritici-repentis Pt-1C-BFP]